MDPPGASPVPNEPPMTGPPAVRPDEASPPGARGYLGILGVVGFLLMASAILGICFGPFEFEVPFPDMAD